MPANLEIHRIESSAAAEIYITATPGKDESTKQQAKEIFSVIREKLCSEKAHILQEKVFGDKSVMEQVLNVRSKAYGDIDDGIIDLYKFFECTIQL